MHTSNPYHARMQAKFACFTRPEFRTERLTNVVGSVSAYEGALRQVMGHRGTTYLIDQVALLFQPRFVPVTANEVKDFGHGHGINTEDCRTLRTTTLLAGNRRKIKQCLFDQKVTKDFAGVDFVVTYRLATETREDFDKFRQMHDRRMTSGRYFRQPYLGLREYPALLEPVFSFKDLDYPEDMEMYTHPNGLKTVDLNQDLGLTFYGTDWLDPQKPNYFAPLKVEHGIVKFPSWEEVRQLGIRREGPAT